MTQNEPAPGDASPTLSASIEDRLNRQFETMDTLFDIIVKKEMDHPYIRDYNLAMSLRAQSQCRSTADTLNRIARHEKNMQKRQTN